MLLLIFGSALIQQWEIASVQMIYVAFYSGLLATVRYDRFSLDGLRPAQKDEYIRSADSPLGEIDHVILSELSGRILSAIFGTRS